MSYSMLGTAVAVLALAATAAPARPPAHSQTPTPAPATARVALTDAQIAAIFEAANTFDIETGAVGERRGGTKAVRDFGAQLVHDHRAVRQQGRDLVKKLGVKAVLPKDDPMVQSLAKDHAGALKAMKSAKHGADFDRAFLQHEVDFHKTVIDAVNSTLLPAIQNAELRKLVTTVAPAFKAHMDKAQSLLDQVKTTASR